MDMVVMVKACCLLTTPSMIIRHLIIILNIHHLVSTYLSSTTRASIACEVDDD